MKIQKILAVLVILLLGLTSVALAADTTNTLDEKALTKTTEEPQTKEISETLKETPNTTKQGKEQVQADKTDTEGDTTGNEGDADGDDDEETPPTTETQTWTDFSNAKITFVDKGDSKEKGYNIKVENVKFATDDYTRYYVFMSNSSTKPTMGATKAELEKNAITTWYKDTEKVILKTIVDEYIEKAGDIYLWIVEAKYNNSKNDYDIKEVLSAKKLTKPAQGKLGTRIMGYFFNDRTSTFLYEPYKDATARKINIKIGRITDNNVLLSIKNGEANCLEKLMTYAKSANAVYTGTVAVGESATITDKFDVVDEGYYYVYMKLDSENGTYREVEDVSLYQGLADKQIGKNLFDYLSSEFKWNIGTTGQPTTPTQDPTTAKQPIPQTGETLVIAGLIAIVVIAGTIGYINYRKYRGIK